MQAEKEEIKLSLFTDDIIICIENLKGRKKSTEKLQQLVCDYSKVVGCKANTQKFTTFLHTSKEQVGFEIKNNFK